MKTAILLFFINGKNNKPCPAAKPGKKRGGTMVNTNLFRDLLRYGKIKSDFEVKDNMGRLFRVRVFEYQEKKYFTVMCDGEQLRGEEV